MDADTRLKALARLAQSHTDAAKTALQSEFDSIATILEKEGDYELLTQSLAALDVFGYRFSTRAVEVLESFMATIETRDLIYSEEERSYVRDITSYKNAQALLIQATEVSSGLRYLETPAILRILLPLARHEADKVKKKAFEALEALAGYNLDVFYGDDRQGGIGAAPQKVVVDTLEALKDDELATDFQASRALLDALLSPTMEGSSWSYKAVTLSRGATPAAPAIAEIRWRSIQLLKRLYRVATTAAQQLSIVNALHGASRPHDRNVANAEASAMIMRDATEVLAFYEQLAGNADLQVVQKIESHSYWIYYHAHRAEIKAAAQRVEGAISKNMEYQIYRVLVGFDGVFGDWAELTSSDRDFSATDEYRRARASEYVATISEGNFQEWRTRILAYAKTESEDLAMFPIFYSFLEALSKAQPQLALTLLREDSESIARFLIPLLRGLWAGPQRSAVRALIESWISEAEATHGRHLFAATKLFLSNETLDIELLTRLLAKAAELKDLSTVRQVISVAVTNYREGDDVAVEELFMPALAVLSRESDAGWIFDAWFRKELRGLLSKLNEKNIELVLQNLKALPKIDYHADEVLSVIAHRSPEAVVAFFCDRIDFEENRGQHVFVNLRRFHLSSISCRNLLQKHQRLQCGAFESCLKRMLRYFSSAARACFTIYSQLPRLNSRRNYSPSSGKEASRTTASSWRYCKTTKANSSFTSFVRRL